MYKTKIKWIATHFKQKHLQWQPASYFLELKIKIRFVDAKQFNWICYVNAHKGFQGIQLFIIILFLF